MEETKAFINALEKWKATSPKIQDYGTLLALLSTKIGPLDPFSKDRLGDLQSRIEYLVDEQGLDEGFLISSLAGAVTTILKSNLERHGDRLVFNESLVSKLGDDDNPFTEKIEQQRDPAYLYMATCDLHNWEEILATHLGRLKRLEWERNREKEFLDKRPILSDIPVPLRDIPIGKLIKRASLSQLTGMSDMDAFRLRREFNAEEDENG